ncbi:hypothetical protein BBUCA112A_J0029 (plasmid) [Borreliella burgdorferi CA-11.2A]|nr:hypothetical protein BBU72A_J0024 [Borreliella burgdorferi 72a]ACN55971.1 hypothetical protein BBUCA112A_J0029 [Borreliella burgdorferi CA-11.2A]
MVFIFRIKNIVSFSYFENCKLQLQLGHIKDWCDNSSLHLKKD